MHPWIVHDKAVVFAMDSPRGLSPGGLHRRWKWWFSCSGLINISENSSPGGTFSSKFIPWGNSLVKTRKLAEVSVVVVAARTSEVVWIKKERVRFVADVGNKAVAVVGGVKEGSGAR